MKILEEVTRPFQATLQIEDTINEATKKNKYSMQVSNNIDKLGLQHYSISRVSFFFLRNSA